MNGRWVYTQVHTLHGDRWLRMGERARERARAELVGKVRGLVAGNGLPADGPVEELTRYDEQGRTVDLVAEMVVHGPAPIGRPVP